MTTDGSRGGILDSPFALLRNRIHRLLAGHPSLPKEGEIICISTIPEGLEITAIMREDGISDVQREWVLTLREKSRE